MALGGPHRIWLVIQWGTPLRSFAIGRYGDLCLWGSEYMHLKFRTGPVWPVSWGLLTQHEPEKT